MEVNSTPRVRVSLSPLLLLSLLLLPVTTTSSPLYAPFCYPFVPESPLSAAAAAAAPNLRLSPAFFSGGDPILPPTNSSARSSSLKIKSISTTENLNIFYIAANINFWGSDSSAIISPHRGLKRIINHRPRLPAWRRQRQSTASFELRGFYSESTRRLCMVGNGLNNLQSVNVVVKLNYPIGLGLDNSIVSGTIIGMNSSQFEPVSILGLSMVGNYTYNFVDTEVKKGVFRVYDEMENIDVNASRGICNAFTRVSRFDLEYFHDCGKVGCNPLGGNSTNLPSFMTLNEIDCGGDKVRYLIDFSDLNFNGRRLPFHPNTTLVAEGSWNENKHLDLVACRWLNLNDSITKASIGDCSIRLSLRFPSLLSLKNRSAVVGTIWSSKNVGDQGYFGKISFQSPTNGYMKVKDMKYVYTVTENMAKTCSNRVADKKEKGKYPEGFSSDMRFNMLVRDGKGNKAWGYSSPLSVGDRFYQDRNMLSFSDNSQIHTNSTAQTGVLNVSYIISFNPQSGFNLGGIKSSVDFVEISAEGIYDPTTGSLCMIGCRHIKAPGLILSKNKTLDCELIINLQYSPLKSTSSSDVKGTIESKRLKSDPLYFNQLKLSATSISTLVVQESIWAMDFEITMVLISNTLMCIFVILQLLYVKKSLDVLPFISLVMLTVLTLAQLIPLVLNFEALFKVNYYNNQNVYLSGGGWIEVNEVLVRVITMIAFLLEFRLLQQAWSSRLGDGDSKALWASDKKVLYISIPVYIGGAIIAWLVHRWKHPHKILVNISRHFRHKQVTNPISFWVDFKSYAGLILDGFLLPQIVFNLFCNTKEKALAPSFYIGTSVVRLLPHAYDLYRAHMSSWYSGDIYADPGMDYYTTTWDITISIGGLVFIVLVYLQQRFGGRCFLPRRFRERVEYEKVPVVSTELSAM